MDSRLNLGIFFAAMTIVLCYASALEAQMAPRYERSIVEVDNPKETLQVLGNLAQRILEAESITNEKRGVDFGISRGFSGSQAAKHLMGLSAASFANGPGRKRRFVDEQQ